MQLAGHSTGGIELTSYQDVAENGPKACQGPERVYKCQTKDAENLPQADGSKPGGNQIIPEDPKK
jgi:hypothetical protein